MLPRNPTCIELKPEDRIELENIQRERQEAAAKRLLDLEKGDNGNRRSCSDAVGNNMEVEVKLRLASAKDHEKVLERFKDDIGEVHNQVNHFFDGVNGELSTKRAVLRVRIYDTDKKATLTLKTKLSESAVEGGVSRVGEVESVIEPSVAHRCVEDPDTILSLGGPVPELVRREGTSSLRSLGSFENVRHEVRWRGGLLEVDETRYEHGTLYEVECETDNPEGVKGLLEEDLRGAGVSFSDGVTSKFANFVNKTLL